ncbi:MAG TPA: hypothetical protein VHT73_11135 [Thermodesulfobacteriota bacterium]|nr:hypothetical protein [Thermodesulfobacteriota bacterium]
MAVNQENQWEEAEISKTEEQQEQKEPEPTINDVYWLIKDIEIKLEGE